MTMTTGTNRTVRALQTFGEPAEAPAPVPSPKTTAPMPKPAPTKKKAAPRPRSRARDKVPRLTAIEQRLGRHLVVALGAVVTIMLGVSLEHLASGIREITQQRLVGLGPGVAIDVGMVASEVALIVLATFPNIRVAGYAHRYVVSIIAISILNVSSGPRKAIPP